MNEPKATKRLSNVQIEMLKYLSDPSKSDGYGFHPQVHDWCAVRDSIFAWNNLWVKGCIFDNCAGDVRITDKGREALKAQLAESEASDGS